LLCNYTGCGVESFWVVELFLKALLNLCRSRHLFLWLCTGVGLLAAGFTTEAAAEPLAQATVSQSSGSAASGDIPTAAPTPAEEVALPAETVPSAAKPANSTKFPESVPSVRAKADFIYTGVSQRAADLRASAPRSLKPIDTTGTIQESQPFPEERPIQWQVAKSKILPLARTSEAKSSQFAASGSPLTIAADPANPELPPVFKCPNPDPDLGCIRVQGLPAPPPPILYLIPRVDFFQSNNLLLGIDPINDALVRPTITLLAVPSLGPNTFILASAEGAFNRYFKVPQFNYDEFRVRAGLLQRLSPAMTAEIGWTNQQLFISGNRIRGFPAGTRFLNDQAIRLELSRRDALNDRLFLNSIYQFRLGFSDPADRSRVLNVLFLSLNYDLNPSRTVQLGLDYQFSAANYTVVPRTDIYQQLLGRVTLNAFRNSQLSLYSGVSFGNSTERGINFNSFVLGVSISVNLVLF